MTFHMRANWCSFSDVSCQRNVPKSRELTAADVSSAGRVQTTYSSDLRTAGVVPIGTTLECRPEILSND